MKVFNYRIIKDYGQGAACDSVRTNRQLKDCLDAQVMVAEGCDQLNSEDEKEFKKQILKYARLYLPLYKYELELYNNFEMSPERVKARSEEMDKIFKKS